MLTNLQGWKWIAIFVFAYHRSGFDITKDFERLVYVTWVFNIVNIPKALKYSVAIYHPLCFS